MRAPHEFRTKQMKKLQTFLARWQGGKARVWEFQAGHCSLTLRIEIEGKRGNLHIVCLGPESIHGPVAWENSHFEVIDNVVIRGQEDGYILRDKAAGFEVLSEGLDVFENCKPIF
jgi:hypothetical protein